MNVLLRRHIDWIAVYLGVSGCMLSGAPAALAQTTPGNPLRPVQVQPLEVPAHAEQARASGSVRTAVHTAVHTEIRNEKPAAPRPLPVRHQPASVSYGSRATRSELRGFVPRHAQSASLQSSDEIIMESYPDNLESYPTESYPDSHEEMIFDSMEVPGETLEGNCCDQSTAECGDCGHCNGCLIPCPSFALDNIELFMGTQGFTGPLNRGETGSFGFHYGVNWGVPIPCMWNQPIGIQVGYRGVNSNFSGASFSEDTRHQSFLTGGLFRRVDWGLQGGVVVDILSDKWYYDDLSLTQLRGELSWVFPQCHELGFFFTASSKTNDVASTMWINGQQRTVIEEYEATDLMAFFYRRRFEAAGGGSGRLFAGFTGHSGGLVGVDLDLPMTENWALKTGFTYLIPQDGNHRAAYLDEAWNVSLSLVWYPGSRKAVGNDYFRPLFDVAHNGIFISRPSQP
ncbi:MAG: DUF6666 family protein [Pirellulaceae bacterium]